MQTIRVTRNQGICTVALNRPEKRNAFQPEMIAELTKTFQKFQKDKALRAVILTGEGKSFCSGGDLEWMKSMAGYSLKANQQDAKRLFDMYRAIRVCPVPVIGRVFGHAFGGGAGLTAVCDLVAAETSTQFSFSEVKWGLVPAVISPFVVDRAQAAFVREWFLTAKVIGAQEALSGGLINFSGDIGAVDSYVEKSIEMILAAAPEAVRETKKLHQSYSTVNWRSVSSKVVRLLAGRRVSQEGQKGLSAFLQKQNPVWSEPSYGTPAKI